ncbi:uncharacterized protein [Drosophila tropicalis]|uniref:uncharacterized protein n=1 Tax=Drosophila tropicalis TaxID=46794 RepID=UPI0035AB7E06
MSNRIVNVVNLSLDEYYERHVRPMNKRRRAGHGPYPTHEQLVRHYHRTHFFGAAYPEQRQRLLNQRALVGMDNWYEHAEPLEEQRAKLIKLEERKRKFAKFEEDQKAKVMKSEKKQTTVKPKDVQAKERLVIRTCEMKRNDQFRPKSKETAREKEPITNDGKATDTKAEVPEPLILKIGDEILYDEAYKNDPLWMQHVDFNYTY